MFPVPTDIAGKPTPLPAASWNASTISPME